MRYALCIQCPPGTAASNIACDFAHGLQARGHELVRVFFQGKAVAHAHSPEHWQTLAAQGTDLVLCSTAATAAGLGAIPPAPFAIGGLVLLAEAATVCDRLVTFGA